MKKLYILLFFAFNLGAINAQVKMLTLPLTHSEKNDEESEAIDKAAFDKIENSFSDEKAGHHQNSGGNREMIYYNDFSNPSDWIISNEVGNDDNWVIGTQGPQGAYPIDPILSYIASNGFALFDSDFLCSGNQIANITLNEPIDCSNFPFVQLKFSQYYRKFLNLTYVLVSLDGQNWTKFEVNQNLTDNQYNQNNILENPDIVEVNISSLASNQSTVYIGFQFYSPEGFSSLAGCAYSWMIDDISLESISGIDLELIKVANSDITLSAFDLNNISGPYTAVPKSQTTPTKFSVIFTNTGTLTANNIVAKTKLFYNGNSYGPFNSQQMSIAPGQIDTILIETNFIPSEEGTVYAKIYLNDLENIEEDFTDITGNAKIKITNNTYALDNGKSSNLSFNGISNVFPEWNILNLYEIKTDALCKGVTFALTSIVGQESEVVGRAIEFNILEVQEDFSFIPLLDNDENVYYVIESDISVLPDIKLITYNFPNNILLESGKSYAVQLSAELTEVLIFFANSGSSNSDFNFQILDGDFFQAQNWLIRLNTKDIETDQFAFNEAANISETQSGNLILSQNQPNPVRENTVIAYELKSAEKVTLEVYDITGKLISSINEGNQAAGNYTINYNASKLNAGIYTYTLVAGDARLTKKMTVIKQSF